LRGVSAVRRTISQLGRYEISDEDVHAWRAMVSSEIARQTSDADQIVRTVIMRYSNGKDLVTRYEDISGKITKAKVREVLEAVSSAGRVEYLIR